MDGHVYRPEKPHRHATFRLVLSQPASPFQRRASLVPVRDATVDGVSAPFDAPNWDGTASLAASATLVGVAGAPIDYGDSLLATGERALDIDGDLQSSRHWFELAYRAAESACDPYVMAVAALGQGGLWVHEHRSVWASAAFEVRLRQALSLIEPGSSLDIRLRARLAAEADYRTGGRAAILAVLEEATKTTDPVARVEALSLAHQCLLGPEHGALRRRLAGELIEASVLTGRRGDVLLGVMWQAIDLFLDGEPYAQRVLRELRGLLAQSDHLAIGYVMSSVEVMLAIRAGRLDEAEQLAEAGGAQGAAAGDVNATGWRGAQLVAIRWYQGGLVELRPMLEELVYSPTLNTVDSSPVAALAVAAAQAGDRRAAAGVLARLNSRELTDLPRTSSWLVTLGHIVEAAYLLDDADTAARAYELLAPFAHLPMIASLGVACFGSVHHALGVASLTSGQLDRAVRHLRAAVHDNLALGHWPAVTASRRRYAEALNARGGPQDVAAAQRELALAEREAADSAGDAVGASEPLEIESAGLTAACVRDGTEWRVELGGRHVLVEHTVGMLHLAVLLANPGVDVPAIDLVAGVAALDRRTTAASLSTQPVLDRTAIVEYQQRLERLHARIQELETDQQPDRVAEAVAERDWLTKELATATGLGGRTRRFSDSKENARVAVGKAIRRAIARVTEADPAIGGHLRRYVYTGTQCAYRPSRGRAPRP